MSAALYFSGYNHTSNISYHIFRATSKNVFWTKILPQTGRSKCYMHPSKAKLKNRSQTESWQKLLRWDSKKADSNMTCKSHLGAMVCYWPQLLQVLTYLHTTIPCQTRQQYSYFTLNPCLFEMSNGFLQTWVEEEKWLQIVDPAAKSSVILF